MAGNDSPTWHSRARLIVLAAVAVALLVGFFEMRNSRTGTLVLEIDQPDAEIWVDGNKMTTKEADQTFDLPAGTHSFRVVKKGFQPVDQTVAVEAREQQIIRVSLDRDPWTLGR
jgi:PEGA domain